MDSPPGRIVAAGRRLFFSEGFEKVSTDRLAKEAAVSKATLYKYFPGMTEVLRAVVEAEAAVFEHGVPTEAANFEDLRSALIHYGTNLLTFLNGEEIIQFCRLMHEEARTHPDIAAAFFEAAYGRSRKILSGLIERGIREGFVSGRISAGDMAEQLLGMWEGVSFVRAQLSLTDRPFEDPKGWATKCVDTLLARP